MGGKYHTGEYNTPRFCKGGKIKLYDMSDEYRTLIRSLLPLVDDEYALYEIYVKLLYLSGKMRLEDYDDKRR